MQIKDWGLTVDWNGLKSFLAIAESGSLSGAARDLGVNHSTMFRRLQSYEAELGGRLFDKIDNRYVLTQLGEELLDRGRQIASQFEEIERRIVGKDVLPRGRVRITAPYNIANRFLPRALAALRATYPQILIEVLSSNLEVNMNSRIADIAIRVTANPPEHLIGRKLVSIPWGIFASPSYLEGRETPFSLDALAEHRLIGGTGQMLNLPAFSWLEQHYPVQIATRCDELTAMSHFAEQGQGLAFLPMDQAREGIVCLGEFLPGKSSDLWLLTHPDLRRTERIRLVMEHLTGYFRQIAY
ncbi:LysR family transcriptional regulator [Marinobacterium zhoushanense]|uniref:LysR family transcriptional regulator n=1 Tax=Marinobacterium zhoushanense TaxID=1679163 RepID=A0ABQ1KJI6_9GAMM|nr:LysR family transcriptional regulator [Marinobacterium zhoushanense]GGB99116.1 LysR family transcriptional regulator [Marinobacterium zhoushanense]